MTVLGTTARAGAAIGALVATADFVAGGSSLSATGAVLGLGLATGALGGLALGALLEALLVVRRRWAPLAWPAAGLLAGLIAARALGAFARIDGPYRNWALLAIAGGALGGLLAGGLVALIQPFPSATHGWIGARPAMWRHGATCLCATISLAAAVADRSLLIGGYPLAHRGLRAFALLALTVGVLAQPAAWRVLPSRRSRAALAAAAALVLLPFLQLRTTASPELFAISRRPFPALSLELARELTDLDRDGYSSVLGGGDCRALDGRVNPGAREIPANGVDDNCAFGDAAAPVIPEPASVPIPPSPSPVNVLLVTVDALRPDRMSLYGYDRDTTPALARWARGRARLFSRAYTSGGSTSNAVPSMMRGVYPRRLSYTRFWETKGFRIFRGEPGQQLGPDEQLVSKWGFVLDDPRPPLAWWLARRGMRTDAVIGDFHSVFDRQSGFGIGFHSYTRAVDLIDRRKVYGAEDPITTQLALRALRTHAANQRFFLWVHYYGVHLPHAWHDDVTRFGESTGDQYDHEVLFWDRHVVELLDAIDQLAEPTVVIITADHGEVFDTATRYHGWDLSEETTRIPLLIAGPGIAPGVDERLASLVDVFPTVLAATQTPSPGHIDGFDLSKPPPASDRVLLTETWKMEIPDGYRVDYVGALHGSGKVILDRLTNIVGRYGEGDLSLLEATVRRYLDATGGVVSLKP